MPLTKESKPNVCSHDNRAIQFVAISDHIKVVK